MKDVFSEKSRFIHQIFLFVLMLFSFSFIGSFFGLQAKAASVPTPTIKSSNCIDMTGYDYWNYGYNTVKMSINCPILYQKYTLQIYRSTSKNGTYSLYDSLGMSSIIGENGKSIYIQDDNSNSSGILYLSNISLNKKYYYKLRLVDADGNKSPFSNTMEYTLKLPPVEVVQCYGASTSSAKLKWSAMDGVDGYIIYRKVSGGKWEKIKTIKKESTVSYTDKNLKSGKTYSYKIRAYKKSGSKKLNGFYSTVYKAKTSSPTVSGDYKNGSTYRLSSSKSKRNAVRRVVQGFKDNYIKSGMSKYDKVLAAYNYLRNNCTYCYNNSTSDINNAYGALVKGRAQCGGYASAMIALCDAINVPCRFISSNSKSKMNHHWNEVKIGGKWYILDAEEMFFLVGSETYKEYGWAWTAKNYPTVSKKDHKKGFYKRESWQVDEDE